VPIADTEIVYSIQSADASSVSYRFDLSAASGTAAGQLLQQAPTSFVRSVRRADLATAARERVLFGSDDPEVMPGQTYAGTSAAVLASLRDTGKVAFVLGVNEPDAGLSALAANVGTALPADGNAGGVQPMVLSGVQALLGSPARHYYRGELERIGADEPFSVLLDGHRANVPAVHARGQLKFADRTITAELWWLDDARDPMTLRWQIGENYEVVTRIDRAPTAGAGGGPAGSGPPATTPVAAGLGGKACRAELTGVYFTTASARVLDASLPALQRFAALLSAHPDWQVTVEGHTDNIGSAAYNLDLSTRRAEAVRTVLVNRYAIPAARLQAKGYGLSRPVESNATDQGRAHNRRVEVSRRCPG
jgi:outer membrane protein OmpA-like peptidoglycan-associated protein